MPEHQWIEKMKNIAKRNIFGFVSFRSGLIIYYAELFLDKGSKGLGLVFLRDGSEADPDRAWSRFFSVMAPTHFSIKNNQEAFINYLPSTHQKIKIKELPEYDLQDPTDLDIMRGQFDMHTTEDWQEYIDIAEERGIGYKNIKILKTAQRKAGIAKYLSPKVINWVLNVVERLDSEEE